MSIYPTLEMWKGLMKNKTRGKNDLNFEKFHFLRLSTYRPQRVESKYEYAANSIPGLKLKLGFSAKNHNFLLFGPPKSKKTDFLTLPHLKNF